MGTDYIKEILLSAPGFFTEKDKLLFALSYILDFQEDGNEFLYDTLQMVDDEAQEKAFKNLVKEGIIK